jgi:hypothetical protein
LSLLNYSFVFPFLLAVSLDSIEMAAAEAQVVDEEFLKTPEVCEDSTVRDCRAKLEFVSSVLSMVRAIETAVPKVSGRCHCCCRCKCWNRNCFS